MADEDLLLPSARDCTHPECRPTFDEAAAEKLLANCHHTRLLRNPIDEMFGFCGDCAHEIRTKWPRFMGPCPSCGAQVIAYASNAHYIYGDW